MDPESAWALVTDHSADQSERSDAADGLLAWVNRGGFRPQHVSHATLVATCLSQLVGVR